MATQADYERAKAGVKDTETDGNAPLMAQLIMKLFDARTLGHVQHLGARTYASHMALGAFYDEIAAIADSICEAWQGTYGMLLTMPNPAPLGKDSPLKSLKTLREWIEANRVAACDDSEIQNLIDEATALIDSTMYKLKFLL